MTGKAANQHQFQERIEHAGCLADVPMFRVCVVNRNFQACNDIDAADLEGARTEGVRAALAIGADEICAGIPFFGAEIRVDLDGEVKDRTVIAMGSSPLQ